MTVRTFLGGLVVVSVALLAPAGLAAERPDDRAGPIGVGLAQAGAVPFEAFGTADTIVARIEAGLDAYGNEVSAVRPDDRAARATPAASERTAVRPDDRADRLTPDPGVQPAPVASTDGGFAWDEPWVLALLTVLVAALAMLAVFVVVYHHHGGPGMRPTPTH